jgi:hypothetical protein
MLEILEEFRIVARRWIAARRQEEFIDALRRRASLTSAKDRDVGADTDTPF